MRYPKGLYAFLLVAYYNVGIVSCRPYPYRPIGVRRSEPGEVPFEDNGEAEPQFSPRHANAFHRRTIGARNQGLPIRPNPYIKGGIPPWGLPPPPRAEKAENQLRNSNAAKYPERNLWVYDNEENAAALFVVGVVLSFSVSVPLAVLGFCWLWALFESGHAFDFISVLFLSCGSFCTVVYTAFRAPYDFYDYLVTNWRLGMERSKRAKMTEADERRWSGEMIFAP